MASLAVVLALILTPAPAQEPSPAPFTYDGAPAVDDQEKKDPLMGSAAEKAAVPKMLDLGRYSLFADPPLPAPGKEFRFDTEVEVVAKMPRDPNDAMAEWWRHWNFEYSIYGHGINIQKPMPGGGFNILPLIDWLKDKAKERRENREPE